MNKTIRYYKCPRCDRTDQAHYVKTERETHLFCQTCATALSLSHAVEECVAEEIKPWSVCVCRYCGLTVKHTRKEAGDRTIITTEPCHCLNIKSEGI